MYFELKGVDGDYLVKNESSILQYKLDKDGNKTGESIMHIITDSIENQQDRKKITTKILEYIIN
jgi:hypothetical protein